jgi:L-glyceraldehyde reductase
MRWTLDLNEKQTVKNRPKLTDDPAVKAIAQRLNATEAQVLIAWGAQRGTTVIPKSVNEV